MATINPTLTLKGIDIGKIIFDFQSGKYRHFVPPHSVGQGVGNILEQNQGKTPQDAIFNFRDKNSHKIVIATTDHAAYEIYGKTGELPVGGRCAHCRRDFKWRSWNIPCLLIDKIYAVKDGDQFRTVKVPVFFGEDCVCCFPCMLSASRVRDALRSSRISHKSSVQLVHMLFSIVHPGEKLESAPDAHLMKHNGGSIIWEPGEVYARPIHVYSNIPPYILAPLKSLSLQRDV